MANLLGERQPNSPGNPTPSTRRTTTGKEVFNSRSGCSTQDKWTIIPQSLMFLTFRSILWLCLCQGYKNHNHLEKIQTLLLVCWGYKKLNLLGDLGWWEEKNKVRLEGWHKWRRTKRHEDGRRGADGPTA